MEWGISREIFEQIMKKYSFSTADLADCMEVNNISATKQLVQNNVGISFLYQPAVGRELEQKKLFQIPLSDYSETRAFHFVFLKNSVRLPFYEAWFSRFQRIREEWNGE